ncbi:hypothetical protein [Reichenbachiella sp. MSK19-1]|uniref:hypothetical protein n=1 Tax=Reichenbachiella sp. MSK19-1 TaxID=1897631 RepID=UPI000E6C0D6F|nr:hypothetical protein [Reichenbachiella sp. MSK19-1]RJE70414.1 hypothetical protein BGP76_09985 [Reichenbachiella sp. MSK19-1]
MIVDLFIGDAFVLNFLSNQTKAVQLASSRTVVLALSLRKQDYLLAQATNPACASSTLYLCNEPALLAQAL